MDSLEVVNHTLAFTSFFGCELSDIVKQKVDIEAKTMLTKFFHCVFIIDGRESLSLSCKGCSAEMT